jgi:transposase
MAGKKRASGRKTKLTPEVQTRIVQAIRGGNYRDTAAAYGGVDETTLYNWMKWGEEKGEGIYFDFFRAVKEAESHAELEMVAQVRLASRDNWAAGMTWLERKFPQKWGRHDRTEHTGDITIRVVYEDDDKR